MRISTEALPEAVASIYNRIVPDDPQPERRDMAQLWFDREHLLALVVALDTVLIVSHDSLSVENKRLLKEAREIVRAHLT